MLQREGLATAANVIYFTPRPALNSHLPSPKTPMSLAVTADRQSETLICVFIAISCSVPIVSLALIFFMDPVFSELLRLVRVLNCSVADI